MTSVTGMRNRATHKPNRDVAVSWDKFSYDKSAHPRLLALRLSCRRPIYVTNLFGEIASVYDCVVVS
jgi:hypothetical protein